ncbi:MAG: hypothetical protein D6718_12410 [Acidobacteria bacterium]|nr:MAG: hypothetical protein D6718_12410 [Acidobacteriota bacterium]
MRPPDRPDRVAAPRTLVAAHDLGELWLATIEGGRVMELAVYPAAAARWVGAIVKGRVTRSVPGVSALFVDVGFERDAFTVWDPPGGEREPPASGDELMVQIVREADRGKGARATPNVTIAGWSLVLVPGSTHRGVSRRIGEAEERDRLRAILERLEPQGTGLIVRTAARGLDEQVLQAEATRLADRWRRIERRAAAVSAPAVLEQEDGPLLAFLRDRLDGSIGEIVVEGEGLLAAVERAAAESVVPLPPRRRHTGPLPAVEAFGLERALDEALAREVRLPGGGRLVIDETEAFVAVDINSGRDTGAVDLEQTAVRTNLAAVAELERQIGLRNLSGLIVVDFIDMRDPDHRRAVNDALERVLAKDRLKTRFTRLSEFSLAEVTRQRRGLPLAARLTEPCPHCESGRTLRPEVQARRLLRELRRQARPVPGARFVLSGPQRVIEAAQEIAREEGEASGLPAISSIGFAVGPPGIERA